MNQYFGNPLSPSRLSPPNALSRQSWNHMTCLAISEVRVSWRRSCKPIKPIERGRRVLVAAMFLAISLISGIGLAQVVSADLHVDSATTSAVGGASGRDVQFNLTVGNDGPSPANGVFLTVLLSSSLTFVSGTASGGCTVSCAAITCGLGTVPAGSSRVAQIVFTPPVPTPARTQSYVGVIGSDFDPNLSNNSVLAVYPEHKALPPQINPICCPVKRGSTRGGTTVVITGSNFVSGATVSFGGVPATSATVDSASQITAVTAAHPAGVVNIVVTNPDTQSATLANGFTYECPAITLSPATLPNGTVGSAYNQTVTGSGGSSPYTFSLASGALPSGLTLSGSGVISGTPTASGSSTFTVKATDAQGCVGTQSYQLTLAVCTVSIAPAPPLVADNVWVEDQVPSGAAQAGTWIWDTTQKAGGTQSSTEPAAAGVHQHYFYAAPQTFAINAGDKLVAYVLLNSCNPPQEVMLQWNDGSWEHRAYWGANLIAWGTSGTASRYPMGALPVVGQWVRLEVPASLVNLEGHALNGMAFSLYGGQAWFDRAGKTAAALPAPTVTAISPPSGPTPGGTPVTITGTNFRFGATVSIGGVAATGVTVVSATSITATTGGHACGTVDVVVTNSDGTSGTKTGGYFYSSPASPTGLSPNGTAYPSSTTSVTLTWAATPGADRYAVRVQDNQDSVIRDARNNCANPTVYVCVDGITTTSFTVTVRAGHTYNWWVHAGNICLQYSAQTNGTFFVPGFPTVTAITPALGPTPGGTPVTITGTNFRFGATVSIGGVAATNVALVSATQITATTAAHACGTVDVVVINNDGSSGTKTGGFFYSSPASPTGLSPNGTVYPSTTTSVTLSWAATPGADRYAVRVQDNQDGVIRDARNNCANPTIYVCVDGVTTTSFTVTVRSGHTYNWWLHAGNTCNQYSVQTNASFSVSAALPAPTVTTITQASGPMAGGTGVTITGTNFRAGATVSIGGVAATGVTVISATSITAVTPAHACGNANVVVTNSDGQSGTLANGFFYTSPQPPTGLSPNGTVYPSTTTSVTLSWAAVSGADRYAVRVQDNQDGVIRDARNNCANPTIYVCVDGVTTTSFAVTVRPGHTYAWWVHAGSSCNQYSVQTNASFSVAAALPAPTVTAITQASGPMAGGTGVTITGTNFRAGATVSIGGVPATGVTVVSATSITATTPAHVCGNANVVVTNSDGQSGTLANGFYYTSPQPPTGLSPNGTTLPGTTTSVTLSWAATPGADRYAVRVQDNQDGVIRDARNNCANPTIYVCVDGVTTTSFAVTVRPGHTYAWWVHAGSSCNQYSAQTNASFGVALPAPTVTAISPTSGPDTGGTGVTISGTGFRGGANVTFGGVAAVGVSVPSATQITATAPARAAGTVNIVVTNSDGQSGTLFSGFTYNLSIPPSPTGLSPNGTTLPGTTTSVTMSWSPTPGATKYAIRLQDNTDGTIRDPRNNCPVNTIDLCVNDITSTSYSAPVTAGHSYTWWVHAGNAAGYSSQTYGSFSVAVDPLHAPTGLYKDAASRNLIWTPPNNLTPADSVTYDLWITGGANCASGCLYHPAAPSWYTMGAEIGTGNYTWTLKANSASRPSSAAVAGPAFSMP